MSHTDWTSEPTAAALLANCGINPPSKVRHQYRFAITTDEWTEFDPRDRRVSQLHKLADVAALAQFDNPDEQVRRRPLVTVDEAIQQAIEAQGAAETLRTNPPIGRYAKEALEQIAGPNLAQTLAARKRNGLDTRRAA